MDYIDQIFARSRYEINKKLFIRRSVGTSYG